MMWERGRKVPSCVSASGLWQEIKMDAGRRLILRVACWRLDAGRSMNLRVACRRSDAGRRLSPRVACRRGAGRSLFLRVACWSGVGRGLSTRSTCPSTESCVAGTDSRVFALCRPRVWGKSRDQWVEGPKVEQWTFEQMQEVDVLAVGEVDLVPQERVRQLGKCWRSSSGPSSRCRWWMVLLVGKTGLSSHFVEQ